MSSHLYSSLSSGFLSTYVTQGRSWPCRVHTSTALAHTGTKVNAWPWGSWRRWWQDRGFLGMTFLFPYPSQPPLHFPVQAPSLLLPGLYSEGYFPPRKMYLQFKDSYKKHKFEEAHTCVFLEVLRVCHSLQLHSKMSRVVHTAPS